MNFLESITSLLINLLNFRRALIVLLTGPLVVLFISKLLPAINAYVEPPLKSATDSYKLVLVIAMLVLAFLSSVVAITILEHALNLLRTLFKVIAREYKKQKQTKLAAANIESEKQSFIDDFSLAQSYILPEATDIIRTLLTEGSSKFEFSDVNIQFLEKRGWIHTLSASSDVHNVYKLHDSLIPIVDLHWNEEVANNTSRFYSSDSDFWDKIISEFNPTRNRDNNKRLNAFDFDLNEESLNTCF